MRSFDIYLLNIYFDIHFSAIFTGYFNVHIFASTVQFIKIIPLSEYCFYCRFLFVCDVMNIPVFCLEYYCWFCCFCCTSATIPGRPCPPTFGLKEFVLCIYITSQQVLCINIDKKMSSLCVLNFWEKTNTMRLMNESNMLYHSLLFICWHLWVLVVENNFFHTALMRKALL